MHEHEITRQFLSAMGKHGLRTDDEIIADGRIRRFHVVGDRRHARNGWYVLHLDDHPAGAFGCNKRFGQETRFTWSANTEDTEKFTPQQRREWKRKMDQAKAERAAAERKRHSDAAARANQIWEAADPAENDHPYLNRKGVKSHGLKVGVWTVANRDTGEITVVSKLALLVPLKASRTEIRSLQAIFPSDRNPLRRDKDYLAGGEKRGLFFVIGSAMIDDTVLICEGYATGSSLHECTGHLVVVAFDTGNLKPVAERFRSEMPNVRIVICADNDQWTKNGHIDNPGVTHAIDAAEAVNGLVAIPRFSDLRGKPTDFNDLFRVDGEHVVRAQIEAVLAPDRAAALTAPPPAAISAPEPVAEAADSPPTRIEVNLTDLEKHGKFAVLGYDHGSYYIFHHVKKQILVYTKSDFTDNGLIEIAEINFWEEHFPAEKGVNRKAAFNWFVAVAHARGIYDIDYIRGRGAWFDSGRIVFHHGEYLTVDGQPMPITDIKSRYVYELNKPLPKPAHSMLSNEDGLRILSLAKMFRWTKPASAALLCGWAFLAPICGALRWRPHIWLTGGPGCGKSTILNQFVSALVADSGVFAQGNSTEAGIRQILKADALPVLYDESEQNEDSDKRRVQNILSLIRQASTESQAKTYKGSANGDAQYFHIRSMFCLASIQVGIKHQADIERLTLLILRRKDDSPDAVDVWRKTKETMYTTIERDRTISNRLLRRAIDLLPVIHANIEAFTEVAAEKFGSQREGDQYGTLLAGAWALTHTTPATRADAQRCIDAYDWSEHREKAETDDAMQALASLTEAHIRVPGGAEVTVYELICAASDVGTSKIPRHSADAILLRYGMRVKDGYLVLSNSSNELRRLIEGTTFEADLRGMLLRIQGADRNDNKPMKFSGVLAKCIRVPIGPLIDGEPKRAIQPEAEPDGRWIDGD